MKLKKILAMVLCVAIVLSTMSFNVFAATNYLTAADVFPAADADGVITLVEDITLQEDTRFSEELKINLNGKTLNLTTSVTFNGSATLYGGKINADGVSCPDGIIRADYHHDGEPAVTLKLEDVTVSAKGVKYGTGLFYVEDENDTLVLTDVDVVTSGADEDPGSGVFYSASSFSRAKVILNEGTTVTSDYSKAIFFATDVELDGATITCSNVSRPVFRQAAGTVKDSTITVNSIGAGQALVADVAGNNFGVVNFVNSTVTAPEGTPAVNFSNAGSAVKADSTSSVGNNEGVLKDDDTPAEKIVATVNGVEYTDIQEAIIAAAPNGTVEIVDDVTVDEWIMISQRLSIGSGQIITLDEINGLTINGKNHTLTINSIESASNGNRLFYDAQNLNINNLTIKYVDGVVGGIGLTSGVIENVTFEGGVGVLPGTGNITITGCTFKTSGSAIYNEEERDNLVVTGNTFNTAAGQYAIYLRGNTTFTDNTVVTGKVNVVSGSPVVTGNNFGEERFKVYNAATATIEDNEINNLVFNDDSEVKSTFGENTLSEEAQAVLDAATAPKGNNFTAYTNETSIWGEVWGNAKESFVIKILDANNNVMGTTSLNNIDGIIDGDVNVTWSIKLDADSNTDGYWTMSWTTPPSLIDVPTKVELWVDGEHVSGGNVVLNGPDDLYPVFAAKTDADGKILGYIRRAHNADASAALASAIASGDNVAILVPGIYKVPTGKNISITGAVDGVKFDMSQAVGVNASMTFNNVTFEYGNANYVGLQHAGDMVYNDCTFNGQLFLYGTSEIFNDCIFNQTSSDAYNVWTYGAKEVEFNECTFNSAGKSVLIYSEQADLINNVTVTKTTFNASTVVEGKAAIEMDSSLTSGINLTIDGETTAAGFGTGNVSGNSLWNNKKGNETEANNDIKVVVDGVAVLDPYAPVEVTTYEELVAALEKDNANIIMMNDITATATQSSGYGVAGIVLNSGDVLEGNGNKLTINGANSKWDCAIAMKGGTVKNLTIAGAMRGIFMPGANGDVIVDNCVLEDVIYTFNSDAGSTEYNVTIKDTNLNGWTSYSAVHKSVAFENCTFGEGNGYAFCRPYQATTFTGCEFNEGFEVDTSKTAADTLEFDDCTYAGEKLSAETAAPMFYNGGNVVIDGEPVEFDKYVPPVAKIGDTKYTSLEEALKAATEGCTIEILADVTVDAAWDCRYNGAKLTVPITINGNGHTLKLTGEVDDKNWNTVFRFESDATVKNLTIDASEATGIQRGISAKSNIVVENCTFIGNGTTAKRGIIYGEGAGTAESAVTATISGCTFKDWSYGVSDSQSGRDSKSVSVTDSTFTNASVLVSAAETVTFTGNAVTEGYVNISSYTAADTVVVTATGNTLVGTDDEIQVNPENITADSSFITPVAKIGSKYYETFEKAIDRAQDNGIVTLVSDVTLDAPVTIKKNITIDGNGHNITQSADCNNSIALLYFEGTTDNVLDVTVKNATFDGLKVGAAIRTLYANMNIDNCVFENCEHTVGQGLVRLTYGTANITNSKFLNNDCSMGISFNWDGAGLATDTLTIDNCEFTGNTANKTALIYYVKGVGCEIKNSEFKNNNVNCKDNGAVIYLGFQENCSVTGNLFEGNVVTEAGTSTRVAGAIFFGYEAEICGNAFVNNTASNANGDALGQICTSTYYDCEINLDGNYWGGEAPVYGKDYTVQHQTGDATFALDTYNASYSLNEDGNVVVGDEITIDYVAQVGKFSYPTLKAAFEAAKDGDTIKLIENISLDEIIVNNKKLTLDLNGKTITGIDNTEKNFSLIDNRSELTVIGNGKITLTATVNSGWNRYSAVLANNPGGKLTIENGTIEHLGGTDMAYGIDNLTNGKGTYAETIINGGVVKSTYRGIRQFLNGVEAQNILTINGGVVEGANKSIFFHDPSKNANSGTLTVAEGAVLNGDVYLFVTEGSTEWPVEVSIAKSTVNGEVVSKNVPSGYEIVENNGIYGVEKLPPALPTATVSEPEINTTVMAMNGISGDAFETPVTFKMNFAADEPTDEQREYYSNWLADYELIINKDIRGTDGYLVGQYDSWSENWVKLASDTSDVILSANTPVKVVEDLMGLTLEYEADILGWVKDFDCGIYLTPEFIKDNPDLEITLALKLYNPENPEESYVIGEAYEFTADDATELFKIAGTTTSLDSSLALNIYVASSDLTEENYYAVVEHEKATGVVKTTISSADWVTSGTYQIIRYTGIAAKEMADDLTITIYNAEDTQVSESFKTSLKDYAISTMNRFVTNGETNSLWLHALTDMLNYGASAQKMFNYKTGSLASAGAEDFQTYASTEYTLDKDGCSLSDAVAGTTLTLEDMISLNVYFKDVEEGMYATYTYTTHAGTQINETVDYDSFVNAWGYKGVGVPVAIADAETLVTVTLFNSDNTEVGTAVFSVNAYLKDMIDSGKTDELYPNLAKFAKSAKAAFAK